MSENEMNLSAKNNSGKLAMWEVLKV